MTNRLSPEQVDRPTAYGFVFLTQLSAQQDGTEVWNRMDDGDVSQAAAGPTTSLVRHCPATPESANETQPIVTPNTVLAYEGRIDNREEIAFTLAMPHLAQAAEGVVLAAAYDAWGAELSAKVLGEYSYAVFDRRSHRLVAGQDSLGVRRIFYGTVNGRLLITSNLRLLFEQFPRLRPPYERDVLREYFTATMAPWSGCTIWRGIRELGRGNAVVQRGDRLEEKLVWRPKQNVERFNSTNDVDEAFRKHLFDAVRASLRAPGPLMCDLSGGYDSSAICAIAALLIQAGESHASLVGWSLVNGRSNERPFQESVQQQYSIERHTLDLTKHLPFQCFTNTEIPLGSFVQAGAINRATREFALGRGIRSRLTGQAADALLQKGGGGAPVYLADWFRERKFGDWYRHFSAYLQGGSYNAWQLFHDCTLGTLDLHAGWRAPIPDWITPQFRKQMTDARHDFLHDSPRVFESDARERIYRWTLCFVPFPGAAMPEQRVPFAHRPLVEFVLNLPWEFLMSPNEGRVLMRRSLGTVLPEVVRSGERCWTAFGAGLYEGLQAAWPRIGRYLTGERLAELGVVELRPFQAALNSLRAGYEGPNPSVTKTALYLETWLGLKPLLDELASSGPGAVAERPQSVA